MKSCCNGISRRTADACILCRERTVLLNQGTHVGFLVSFSPRFKSVFKYVRCYTHTHFLSMDTKYRLRRNRLPIRTPRTTMCIGLSMPMVYADAAVCTGACGAKLICRLTQERSRIHPAMKRWSRRRDHIQLLRSLIIAYKARYPSFAPFLLMHY